MLACNIYDRPFESHLRPRGYPWKFDPALGMKVFDLPGAPSLTDQGAHPLVKRIPAGLREHLAEWVLRQHLPVTLVSRTAALIDRPADVTGNINFSVQAAYFSRTI